MFFKKAEPALVGKLTAKEKQEFENIIVAEDIVEIIINNLVKKQKSIIKSRVEWWKKIEQSKEITINKETECLELDKEGNIFLKQR